MSSATLMATSPDLRQAFPSEFMLSIQSDGQNTHSFTHCSPLARHDNIDNCKLTLETCGSKKQTLCQKQFSHQKYMARPPCKCRGANDSGCHDGG